MNLRVLKSKINSKGLRSLPSNVMKGTELSQMKDELSQSIHRQLEGFGGEEQKAENILGWLVGERESVKTKIVNGHVHHFML